MFVGGIGAEQSADLEAASGQTRVVRRPGLYRSWLVALLGFFRRFDSGNYRIRL